MLPMLLLNKKLQILIYFKHIRNASKLETKIFKGNFKSLELCDKLHSWTQLQLKTSSILLLV